MNERQRRELEKVEIEYMETYERGKHPTLEELILRYPGPENGELRAEIAGFVLDYIELENAARRVELTEEDLANARVVQERAALTREILASRSGVSRKTIGDLENGRRGAHPSTLGKISEALGVEPRELIYRGR